jgi:hypothetical protein
MTAEMPTMSSVQALPLRSTGEPDGPVLELTIAANDPPWGPTFEFMSDVYSVLRASWIENVSGIEDYAFRLTGLEEGSKKFKGKLRRRPGSSPQVVLAETYIDHAEFKEGTSRGGRRVSADAALAAGAVVLASLLGGFVQGLGPADIANPEIEPWRIERMTSYVGSHAGEVRITVVDPDGSILVIVIPGQPTQAPRHGGG